MANPLEQSIQSAVRANATIGKSFARLGTKDHPRGFVLAAYRNANRAMKQALKEANRLPAALEVMAGLRSSLRADVRSEFTDMHVFGQEEAARQLSFYGIAAGALHPMALSEQIDSALDAVLAKLDVQTAATKALLLTGADERQIVGDYERAGSLCPTDVVLAAAFWAASLVWTGFDWQVGQQPQTFKKQVIAALDNRTTDCCLQVHGQIQPMDQPFHLTGTPGLADDMAWPAFHAFCRTSGVLYLDEYDLGLTARMQAGAQVIIVERANGVFLDRKPGDGFG